MSHERAFYKDTYLERHDRRRNAAVRKRRTTLAGVVLGTSLLLSAVWWLDSTQVTSNATFATVIERVGVRASGSTHTAPTKPATRQASRLPFEPRVPTGRADEPDFFDTTESAAYPGPLWRSVTVEPGDSLSLVFNRIGADRQDIQRLLKTDQKSRSALVNLSPGQILRFRLDAGGVEELVFERDILTAVHFKKTPTGFRPGWVISKPEVRLATAIATINHSLFIDGQKAGLTDKTIMEFINVYGWDVDFLRDLQRGDQFSVVFEEFYKDGRKFTNGRILAAEFVNKGKALRTVYYDNGNGLSGYFSDKGETMRKAFLRTPVNFTRISSRFSLARRHPLLNRIRAHKGVDYSAPTGTPIQSVADGKVLFVGWKGGYGNVIQLKHGEKYSTLYGHMSKFARGVRAGSTVSQGQTIGYVGRTGLATGPHLHYEFLINGTHHDPLKVKLPNSLPLDPRFKAGFLKQAQSLLARLDSIKTDQAAAPDTMVAKVEENTRNKRRAID